MLNYGLNRKNIFVTGAARGIGKATALVFASYGANLILADIDKQGVDKTAKEIIGMGSKALALELDIRDTGAVAECVKKAIDVFSEIHVLANCAGISNSCLLNELSIKDWDKVMDINAKGVFVITKAVTNHMVKKAIKGKVISIASQASKMPELGNGVYGCSKAVVNMLSHVFALELAEYGINVNSVCPGYVNTEMMQAVFRERGPIEGMTAEKYEEKLTARVPLGRMAEPEEIGEFLAFLASDKSTYITGMALTIAGGSTLI